MHLSLELLGICHNVDVLACCDDVSRSFLNMLSDGTTEIQVNLLLFKFSVSKNRSIEVSPVRLLQGARLRSDGAYINQHDDKLSFDFFVTHLRLVLCGYDATVFPSNATYVRQSITALATILGMGSDYCGHYQAPVFQSQTTMSAMIKHRRLIEDQMISNKLSIVNSFQLLYSKEESTARDTRALSQQCIGLVHANFPESSWLASRALVEGKLGPVPLLPFAQFLGYDDTTRPGASARVEQMLSRMFQTACVLFTFFFGGGSMFQTCVGQSDACQEGSRGPQAGPTRLHGWHGLQSG